MQSTYNNAKSHYITGSDDDICIKERECDLQMTSSHTSTSEMPSTLEKMVGEDILDEDPLPLHAVKSLHGNINIAPRYYPIESWN